MSIEWTELAADDLVSLIGFIGKDDRASAERIGREILAAVALLDAFPGMGRLGRVAGTREFIPCAIPYVVVYQAHGRSIQILRVLHTAQQWPRH